MFASNGILFNHESPRRGETFVTRKITIGLAKIKLGMQEVLMLGNLDAKRDWGYAKDYVTAIHSILQHSEPDDFVIATGENHSIREFAEAAGKTLGFDISWKGKGVHEIGIDRKNGKTIIKVDPSLFRPAETEVLLGDSAKAQKVLQWKPKTSFTELADLMARADYDNILKSERKQKVRVRRFI